MFSRFNRSNSTQSCLGSQDVFCWTILFFSVGRFYCTGSSFSNFFINANNWMNKGKQKFSATRAVFLCNMMRGNKVTILISICTIYVVLIWLISAFLYFNLRWAHDGSNSWEKPTASSTKMEQWSMTPMSVGKPRAVDNVTSLFWGWRMLSRNREWFNKKYAM